MSAVFKKEFAGYFRAATGYIYFGVYILFSGICFWLINISNGITDYAGAMSNNVLVMLLLVPVVTMRLFAEEARQKTDQLLFTSPIKPWKIVIGKFFAAYALYSAALIFTVIFPIIISFYGNVAVASVFSSYLGYWLLGACYISVGMFISSLTQSQVASAIISVITLLSFLLIDAMAASAPISRVASITFVVVLIAGFAVLMYFASKNILAAVISLLVLGASVVGAYFMKPTLFDGAIYKALTWVSINTRVYNFGNGILNLTDIVFFVTFSALFVVFTIIAVLRRRWK